MILETRCGRSPVVCPDGIRALRLPVDDELIRGRYLKPILFFLQQPPARLGVSF